MNAFRSELITQNWEIIYEEDDNDKAYETFFKIFKSLYDKNCPIKQYSRKQNYTDSRWITKELQNVC